VNLDGKSLSLIQRENITAEMGDAGTVRVVQVESDEKWRVLTVCLDDDLLFFMNLDDAVGASEDIGSDTQLESWPGEGSTRYGVT